MGLSGTKSGDFAYEGILSGEGGTWQVPFLGDEVWGLWLGGGLGFGFLEFGVG